MTIKAVVFDAYGTLYDVQSVTAVTDEGRYEDFSVIMRQSLTFTRASGANA